MNFARIAQGVDVQPIRYELERQPALWNRNPARLDQRGPHRETDDIWIRYNDEAKHKDKNYAGFNDAHDSIWYPSYYLLPSLRNLIFNLMRAVEGERLGGVLIYRVPPGKQIYPHTDAGWHVEYFDKYNVYLQSDPRARFCFSDGTAIAATTGDVYWFRNDVEHAVVNESDEPLLVLTVCARVNKG